MKIYIRVLLIKDISWNFHNFQVKRNQADIDRLRKKVSISIFMKIQPVQNIEYTFQNKQ